MSEARPQNLVRRIVLGGLLMKQTMIALAALAMVVLAASGCVSTAEKTVTEPTMAQADIQPPAVKVVGKLGEVLSSSFTDDVADVYFEFAVEKGAVYDIYVVDGYNNGQNPDMKLEGAAKAVGFWILRSDAKTTYPQSVYAETDEDSKGGYGFIGFTLDGEAGQVATVTAQDTLLFVHVQRYKASYLGNFMVKVVKK